MTPEEHDYERRPSRTPSLIIVLVLGVGMLALIAGLMGHIA